MLPRKLQNVRTESVNRSAGYRFARSGGGRTARRCVMKSTDFRWFGGHRSTQYPHDIHVLSRQIADACQSLGNFQNAHSGRVSS